MFFVRKFVSICLHHNIQFKAKHIPGVRNQLADALSRLQAQTFMQLAPAYTEPFPTEVPLHLQPQELGALVTKLASSSLQPSSLPTCRRAWRLFRQFLLWLCLLLICMISSMHPPLLALMCLL